MEVEMSSAIQEQDYTNRKVNFKTWSRILGFAKDKKKYIIIAVTFGMLTGVLDLCTNFISMWAIDGFIVPGKLDRLPLYILLAIMMQFGFGLFTIVFVRACGMLEAHLATDIRNEAFRRLQMMSFSYYDKTPVGYLLTRLTNDVARATETISWCFIDVGWGTMALAASLVGMFVVNAKLALILVSALPIMVVISIVFQKRILRYQRNARRLNSMITSSFNEGIMGAKTTKTLVREELNNKEMFSLTGNMRKASMRAVLISSLYMPVASMAISIAVAFVLNKGGYDVLSGVITIGQLNFFMQIGNLMFEPIRNFARIFAELQSSQAAAERVVEVLNAESDIRDYDEVVEKYGDIFNGKTENWEPIKGDVEFRNVSFSYKDGEVVLKNFDLKVEAGQSIALVGETGSGKSTIVNLICRFYEPQEGTILIDGKDIRERSQLWLQSNLGYVLQTPQLFSGSIRENIRYGKLDATDEEVENAAKMVGAHEFIMSLEKGYDTEVGEGGGLISTGQKQLISFARAIIADPRIFVLDEATSSIDTESEMKIQKASETLLRNRTSFIIAHRLSTIRHADRILVIENGEITEQGTHDELMRLKGYYYELYTNQFKSDKIKESLKILT
jgi:ATP-binding cassette subfamily B protein